MTNPVNDNDLKETFPKLERQIILLSMMHDIINKMIQEHRVHQVRIINSALEYGYTLKEVDKIKGKVILLKGDDELLEKELRKMGL